MKATVDGPYKKLNKNGILITMFRCIVAGTVAALADYKTTQGENYRENDKGQPLFFTDRPPAKSFDLVKTRGNEKKGPQYIADTSELDLQKAIVSQAGGNLGQEMAKIAASRLVFGNSTSVEESAPAAVSADNLSQA